MHHFFFGCSWSCHLSIARWGKLCLVDMGHSVLHCWLDLVPMALVKKNIRWRLRVMLVVWLKWLFFTSVEVTLQTCRLLESELKTTNPFLPLPTNNCWKSTNLPVVQAVYRRQVDFVPWELRGFREALGGLGNFWRINESVANLFEGKCQFQWFVVHI